MSQSKLKRQLRQQLLCKRNSLTSQEVQTHSKAIIEKILTSDWWPKCQHIGLYLPINKEVDLTALLKTDKTCYIPSVHGNLMQFHRHHQELRLNTTSYGLSQPEFVDNHHRPDLDLCFLPLVGFDAQGHRLGMGGGFYDRYFAANKNTVLWGVAHAAQQCEQLPLDPWDVKLHGIITEQDWILI